MIACALSVSAPSRRTAPDRLLHMRKSPQHCLEASLAQLYRHYRIQTFYFLDSGLIFFTCISECKHKISNNIKLAKKQNTKSIHYTFILGYTFLIHPHIKRPYIYIYSRKLIRLFFRKHLWLYSEHFNVIW